MGLHPTKLEEIARSAVILRISMAKRHVAAGTYSLPTTNEKRKTYAQQNLLKRKRLQPEHKASKRYVEVAISDLHRNIADYIAPSPRQQICPAAADTPGVRRWSPEDGGEGLRRVLLLRPLVRRKATIKSTRAMRYSSLKKPMQTIQAKRRFLIIRNKPLPREGIGMISP